MWPFVSWNKEVYLLVLCVSGTECVFHDVFNLGNKTLLNTPQEICGPHSIQPSSIQEKGYMTMLCSYRPVIMAAMSKAQPSNGYIGVIIPVITVYMRI